MIVYIESFYYIWTKLPGCAKQNNYELVERMHGEYQLPSGITLHATSTIHTIPALITEKSSARTFVSGRKFHTEWYLR